MPELPSEEDPRLVRVFSANRVWNGVTTLGGGRMFVNFPNADGPGVQAAEVTPDGTITPYPNAAWNAVRDDHDPSS
jgi:hypothetical protein